MLPCYSLLCVCVCVCFGVYGVYVCVQAPSGEVQFKGWEWTEASAQCVASIAPQVGRLKFGVKIGDLDDATLTALLHMGPRLRTITTDSLKLICSQHADRPWPWDRLSIDTCDLASLARLPDPRGSQTPVVVRCKALNSKLAAVSLLLDACHCSLVGSGSC